MAVQRWVHDLDAVDRMTAAARAGAVGRDQETDVELPDAPASAHVKRTAQESFDPEAFILRRSMPYGGIREHGLNFIAFGESLDRFERQLRRMSGHDDGVPDGILSFTRAVSGGYYFCPPLRAGRLRSQRARRVSLAASSAVERQPEQHQHVPDQVGDEQGAPDSCWRRAARPRRSRTGSATTTRRGEPSAACASA